MRFSWALYEDPAPRIVLGPSWATGWTVQSSVPDVFIVPSEFFEGGSHPVAWARSMDRATRLWYVTTPPRFLNPSYAALLRNGWHPTTTLHASGCEAILLVRPSRAS